MRLFWFYQIELVQISGEKDEIVMKEIILQTDHLTKQYGTQKAVDEVNIHVERGAIYGLIGKNGAGKTTILKILSGLATPTSGEMELFGYRGKELSAIRERVGCLIENPGLYSNMSAYENLKLKCILFGISPKSYVNKILKTVGLENAGLKKVKNFSLGMKQRLGIALALVGNPDLLILDEPINGLDPNGIAEIRETILRINKEQNITIMISSHILEELSKIATQYGIIDKGQLLSEMSQEELLQQCQEKIVLKVREPREVIPVLDSMMIHDFCVMDSQTINIYERLEEINQINKACVQAGILIEGIFVKKENLEEYFLQLTGGKQNHA